jgi:hypothetical protein
MKRLTGFAVVLVALLISGSVFAAGVFPFEFNGKKYEAAPQDLYGYYTFAGAKVACALLVVDTDDSSDDWFLPSKAGLKAMYEQLHKKGVGGFNSRDYYWSYSKSGCDGFTAYGDYDSKKVWALHFYNGYQDDLNATNLVHVRCVRAL